MVVNTVLSAGIFLYAVNTEHRITKLETHIENLQRQIAQLDRMKIPWQYSPSERPPTPE